MHAYWKLDEPYILFLSIFKLFKRGNLLKHHFHIVLMFLKKLGDS